ncbi:MAG: hypothetical protein ACQ9ET_03525 [Nitrosomonadaceae bacterium]
MIRRSDDTVVYNYTTDNGKKVTGSIRSEMKGGKLEASILSTHRRPSLAVGYCM